MERSIMADIFSQDVIDEFDRINRFLTYKCNLEFDYWQENKLSHRDEFYLTFYVLLMLLDICKEGEINEWKLKFDVAFLYHVKFLMESCISIDMALKRNYYTVCYPLLRSVHSNLFLVILSSFNPELFDHWLKNQKDNRYTDGNIRKELLSHGLYVYNHLYSFNSGITHGMHDGLARAGYLNQKFGILHEIIRNRIYLYSKFLIGTYAYTGFAAMGIDLGNKKTKKYYIFEEIFKILVHEILLYNRLENIHLYFPIEGYEVKDNDQYIQAGTFSFEKYNELLSINYLNFPESIILSKKYRIS